MTGRLSSWKDTAAVQGLLIDGAHAVVDKGAAEKHSQRKDPGVILRVTLEAHYSKELRS